MMVEVSERKLEKKKVVVKKEGKKGKEKKVGGIRSRIGAVLKRLVRPSVQNPRATQPFKSPQQHHQHQPITRTYSDDYETASVRYQRRVLGFTREEYDRYVRRPGRVGRGTYEVEVV